MKDNYQLLVSLGIVGLFWVVVVLVTVLLLQCNYVLGKGIYKDGTLSQGELTNVRN